jgi:hypothetical protein
MKREKIKKLYATKTVPEEPNKADTNILKEHALQSFYYWYMATKSRSHGIPRETVLNILVEMAREYCQIAESTGKVR